MWVGRVGGAGSSYLVEQWVTEFMCALVLYRLIHLSAFLNSLWTGEAPPTQIGGLGVPAATHPSGLSRVRAAHVQGYPQIGVHFTAKIWSMESSHLCRHQLLVHAESPQPIAGCNPNYG